MGNHGVTGDDPMPITDDAAIAVSGLTRRYRRGSEEVVALDDVSLRFAFGKLTGVAGPSGSGKTTLLNLLMGEDAPDAGSITGITTSPRWDETAVVPQQLGLLEELSVRENVTLPLRLGAARGRDPDEVMAALGVAELADRLPEETSLGQQQRTAIARALVVSPSIVIVDEPTSHQDEVNVEIVAGALAALAQEGTAVIVATHDDRLIERCDRVVHLSNGRVVDGSDATA